MPKGLALHIGVSFVDRNKFGSDFPAPGCREAALAMEALTTGFKFQASKPLTNAKARISKVKQAFLAQRVLLTPDDIFCISLASHGVLFTEESGNVQPAFLLHDFQLLESEFIQMLTGISVRCRVLVIALACFGPLSDGQRARLERSLTLHGVRSPRVLMYDEVQEYLASPSGWKSWVRSLTPHTLDRTVANVLVLTAAKNNQFASAARPGQTLPPFTNALVRLAEEATSYRKLRDAIEPETTPVTPGLNESLSDGQFADQDPFLI